jgi:hypothetical protein
MSDQQPDEPTRYITLDMFNELQLEVMTLKAEVARLREMVEAASGPDGSSPQAKTTE